MAKDFIDPRGFAVDGAGNFYVVDDIRTATGSDPSQDTYSCCWVKKYLAAQHYSSSEVLPVQLNKPVRDIAVDRKGNVFMSSWLMGWDGSGAHDGEVDELKTADGYETLLKLNEGLLEPDTLSVDTDSNVYVVDRGDKVIKKLTATDSYARLTTVYDHADAYSDPATDVDLSFAVDVSGNVFAYNLEAKVLQEILAEGGYRTVRTIGTPAIATPVHDDRPAYPVLTTQCEPLPPAANERVKRILTDHLQDTARCPAGTFPRRYGSGKDLSDYLHCVDPKDHPGRFADFPDKLDPIADPIDAESLADALGRVTACPPGLAAFQDYTAGNAPPR